MQAKSDGKGLSRQLNVMDASVGPGCEDASRQHAFTVQSTEGAAQGSKIPTFELQAEGPVEQQDWMTCINVRPTRLTLRPFALCSHLHVSVWLMPDLSSPDCRAASTSRCALTLYQSIPFIDIVEL